MTPEQFAALLDEYALAVLAFSIKETKPYLDARYAARTAVLDAYAQAVDGWHMANGVADLAMKHRDIAEARAGGAVKVPDEPDAWLFRGKGDGEGAAFATVCPPDECTQHYPLERWTRGYTFTPLYTHPPAEAATARLRELEADAARYRGLRNMVACGNENVELEFDSQVDAALQEKPR